LENSVSLLDDKSIQEEKNLIEFYQLITLHSTKSIEKKRFHQIKNRFLLRHKFGLTINTAQDFVSLKDRMKYFDLGLEVIIERRTRNIVKYLINEINELCNALNLELIYGIQKVCQRLRCLPLSCALIYASLGSYECSHNNKDNIIEFALEVIVQVILASKQSESKFL